MNNTENIFSRISPAVGERIKKFDTPYVARGVLTSEMVAVCGVCEMLGVKRIIESGRANGHSTEILSKYFKETDVQIDSIEYWRDGIARDCERRLQSCSNVSFRYGNSEKIVPGLLARHHKKTAILIDGPKGLAAVRLIRLIFRDFPHVAAVFLHDTHKGSEGRTAVEEYFSEAFFTDDAAFVKRFSYLDASIPFKTFSTGRYSGDPSAGSETSYGPTFAIITTQSTGGISVMRRIWINLRAYFLWGVGIVGARYRSLVFSLWKWIRSLVGFHQSYVI